MARTLGDAFVRIRPDTSTFPRELDQGISRAQRGVGSRLGGFAKMAGLALGAAGAYGAVQFAKGAVKLESDFGKTMNMLQANLQAPQREMRRLDDLAMKMGADTVFSASAASEAMLELAKGGLSAAAIRAGALESSLTLAAAGGVSMERAATVMGNALNTFNMKAKDSGAVAAALAGAANASSASIDSIAQGLAQAGTVAADAGMSVQEVTAAIAAMANAGMQGSDAGTSMKTMFTALLPSTKQAKEAFENFGLSSYQSSASLERLHKMGIKPVSSSMPDVTAAIRDYLIRTGEATEGTAKLEDKTKELLYSTGMMQNAFVAQNGDFKSLTQIAGILDEKFGDLSRTERAAALQSIFGSDARRAATILTNEGSEGLAKYVRATSDATAAEKQAAAGMKGTAGALEQMHGSIETAQLAWGKAQKPLVKFGATVITEIANGAVPIIEDFGGLLRKHLGGVDVSKLGDSLKNVDLSGTFDKIRNAVKGIDWDGIGEGFQAIKDGLKGSGPEMKAAGEELPTLTDALDVGAVVAKFFAENADTLAKALPYLALGFVAVKAAQAAANTAALISVPVRIAEVLAIRAQTKALAAHGLAMTGSTLVTQVNTTMTMRQRLAMIASAVATKVMTGVTWAFAAAQRVLNAVMRMNPIGIVITLLLALGAGLVLAYKKSETFRKIVDGAWRGIRKGAEWAWDGIKKVFGVLKDWVTKTLPDAFSSGVSRMSAFWDGLKQAAAVPVNFIIDTVYNKGLRKMLNLLPGVNLAAAQTVSWGGGSGGSGGGGGRAALQLNRGGPVRGGVKGQDSVPAWLTPDEHVWTEEEVKAAGGHRVMLQLRRLVKMGGLGKSFDPGAPGFAKGGFLSPEQVARGQAFAKAEAGKPYLWGGVGPSGYDCSGFMSAITNVLLGRSAHSRLGATASFPWSGFKPGPGEFTIGSSKSYAGGIGHMAGTLAGLNVESAGGVGTRVGPGARGWSDPGFTTAGHLGASGAAAAKSGGFWGIIQGVKELVGDVRGWVRELSQMGGWAGLMRDMIGGVVGGVRDFINDKIPGPGPLPKFDRGGKARGRGYMVKDTLRPERVLSPSETSSYDQIGALIAELRRGSRRPVRLVVDGRSFEAYIEELADDRIDVARDMDDHIGRGDV